MLLYPDDRMQRLGFLLFFLLLNFSARSQEFFFEEHHLLKKIEDVQVFRVLQDRVGFLWIGTNKGLFKFNGKKFKRFAGQDLPDENVTALAEDSLGRIWTGFKNGKISILENEKFTLFEPAEGMPKLPISDILFDKRGLLWFSTLNDGTYYFLNSRLYRLDDIDGMPDLFCYDLEEDGDGNIWVGTDGGVAVCSFHDNAVEIKVLNYSTGLPDNIVRKILREKNGNMYLGMQESGVAIYQKQNQKIIPITAGWSGGSVNDILKTNEWLWVASENGLYPIDLLKVNSNSKPQFKEQVISLANDAEGNFWIGTKTNLIRSLGNQLEFVKSTPTLNVLAIAIDQTGSLWYSDGKTLIRQMTDGTIAYPLANTAYKSKGIISLYADDRGVIWAGLYGEGILRIDSKTYQVKILNAGLRNGSVLNISGKGNKIWLATLGGASEVDIDKLTIKNYSTENGLSTDYIYQVFTDSKNRTWFATDRNGVDMLDAKGFHHFQEGFDAKVVYGLAEDSEHHIWANVQGVGLLKFDEKRFMIAESQKKMHGTDINVLTQDQLGRLVAMHETGIDFFDSAKNQFHFLDEASGLRNIKPNLNAVAQDARGKIYVGTDHGIVIFLAQNNIQQWPKPHIGEFKIDGQFFDLKKTDRLSYDQNNITITFEGFWYQNPDAVSFSYRLENFDADWISTLNNSVTYSQLPPGDYTFQLKASANNEFTSAAPSSIHFVIRPPFWRTYLFYTIVIASIAVGSYFFIYLRQRKLVADKHELEVKVRLRTLEIENKTMEIQAQAEEIKGINENLEELVRSRTAELEYKNKALEDYAFINAHQLRAPVASILGLIHLMQKLDLKEEEKEYLAHLKDSARKLDDVVTSITEAIERGEFRSPS